MANTHTTLAALFTDIANAIRSKTGGTAAIVADNFPAAIQNISTAKPTQEKTVTAGTSATTVTPDSGKVLTKVTVNPTPSQSKSATPSTSAQTINPDSDKLLSSVTVAAMPTATQATPSIAVSSGGLITASATQSAGYVAAGTKSATKQLTTQAAKTITPSTSAQTAVASGVYTTGTITVAGDADLIAGNIKSGVNIFGVTGTLKEGIPLPPNFTKYAVDKVTFSSSGTPAINHSLGEMPRIAIIAASTFSTVSNDIIHAAGVYDNNSLDSNGICAINYAIKYDGKTRDNTYGTFDPTNTTVTFSCYNRQFPAGIEYTLITMA